MNSYQPPYDNIIDVSNTATVAIIGYTETGDVGKPLLVTNFSEYEESYGDLTGDHFMPYCVKNFFDEGGKRAYIIRHGEKVLENNNECSVIPSYSLTLQDLSCYLDSIDDFDLLITPDITNEMDQSLIASYCEKRKDCFFIGSVAEYFELSDREDLGYNSHSAFYTPYLAVKDSFNRIIEVPPVGAVAGVFARTDRNHGIFKSPAGISKGNITSTNKLNYTYSRKEQDDLNSMGINVLRNMPGMGNVIWGNQTTTSNPEFCIIPVRRLVSYIEKSISKYILNFEFEAYTPIIHSRMERHIRRLLRDIWEKGGLKGRSEDEAFCVRVYENTSVANSLNSVDLNIEIGIAAQSPGNFTPICIKQKLAV